jgi:hypothetical protein
MKTISLLKKIWKAPLVNSGEEFDYHYVEDGKTYSFNTFNKKAMLVLPPKPKIGDTIYFCDRSGSTQWFPVTIHRNGNPIMGDNEHMNCDVPNINFKMRYVGGFLGWEVSSDLSLFARN